jgi:hypothetical protein
MTRERVIYCMAIFYMQLMGSRRVRPFPLLPGPGPDQPRYSESTCISLVKMPIFGIVDSCRVASRVSGRRHGAGVHCRAGCCVAHPPPRLTDGRRTLLKAEVPSCGYRGSPHLVAANPISTDMRGGGIGWCGDSRFDGG